MWYLVLGFITTIYLILNLIIPSGGTLETYVLKPALWIVLAVITYIIAQQEGLEIWKFKKVRRWSVGNSPIQAGIMIGGFQIALLILVGIFAGFGKSPYSFTPIGIITNASFVVSFLLGTELSRAYLIKKGTTSRKYTTLVLTLITFLYLFIQLSPTKLTSLSANVATLEFLGNTLITALAMNLLASYLAYLGGATASMGYMGILLLFQWFSPILPNPHWTIQALIGTIAPTIGYIIIQNSIQPFIDKKKQRRRKTKPEGYGWTAVAVFSLLMVFFSYGFLGVEPTVIYSGSMQPVLHVGDIVLLQKVDTNSLKVGDIVQYISKDNMTLIHRLYNISEGNNGRVFITKGDANDDPDLGPVSPNQILGKAVFTIPALGWVQIYVKGFFGKIGVRMK